MWLTGFFSGVRALEKIRGYTQDALRPKVRIISAFHLDYPHTALGKHHTTTKAFTFDEEVMSALGITPGDVYKYLPDNSDKRRRALKQEAHFSHQPHTSHSHSVIGSSHTIPIHRFSNCDASRVRSNGVSGEHVCYFITL